MSALNKVHFTFLSRLDSTTDQKERDNLFIELFGFPEIVFINELQQSIFRGKKTAELRGIVYNPLSAVKSDSRYVAILNELSKTDKLPPLSPTEANQNLKGANEKVSDKKAVYPFKKPASENTVMSGVVTVNDLPIRALNTEVDGETVNYMVFDQFAGLSLFTEGDKRSTVFKENLRILKNTGLFQMESRIDEQGKTLTSMALPLIISTVSYDLQGNPITRTFKLVKFVPANPDAKGKKKTVIWSPLSGIGDLSEGKRNLLKKKTDDMDLEIYGTGRLKGEKMFTDAEIDAQSKKDLVDTINFTNDRLMETLGRSGLPLGTSAVYVETFEFGSNEVGSNGATVAQWENMWNNRDLSKMENANGVTEDQIESYVNFEQFVGEGNDYSSRLTREEKESLYDSVREAFFGTPLSETDDTVCNTKSKK
jgi:hypothetical protein